MAEPGALGGIRVCRLPDAALGTPTTRNEKRTAGTANRLGRLISFPRSQSGHRVNRLANRVSMRIQSLCGAFFPTLECGARFEASLCYGSDGEGGRSSLTRLGGVGHEEGRHRARAHRVRVMA